MNRDHTSSSDSDHTSPTTRHARIRCQQRGISGQMLDLLLDHGKERHLGHGVTIVSFPKDARERLRRSLPRKKYAALDSRLNVYAIVGSNGRVMTVGHRYQPLRDKH